MNLYLILFSIVIAFFVLQLPNLIYRTYEGINVENIIHCRKIGKHFEYSWAFRVMNNVSDVTIITNSCINFVIYSFVGTKFRLEFRQLLHCGPATPGSPSHTTQFRTSVSKHTEKSSAKDASFTLQESDKQISRN